MLLRNNSMCPKCSGMLKMRYDATLKCVDCKTEYVPCDEGFGGCVLRYMERKNGLHKDMERNTGDEDLGY